MEGFLNKYLMNLYDDKILAKKDFSLSISGFSDYISDLALDLP